MSLFYRTIGEGIPVVIIHGLYGSSDNWVQIARKLPQGYKAILIDQRNHGESPHTTEHTYDNMVTDLAWLFHELNIDKAHLLGHSMGGKVAMAFAADFPEKVISLTVADITPKDYLNTPASAIQYNFHKHILETMSQVDPRAYSTRKEVEEKLKLSIPEQNIRKFILKNLRRKEHHFEWKINVPLLQDQLRHIISGVDSSEFDDRIPIQLYPVLFIKGGLSGYIQKEDIPVIKSIYPDAKIATIEGATHFLHAEKPDEFVSIFSEFILSN
jgi:pimeloyl-ACP methyl ester carboxylesterase